jgi:hypothetical protein
MSVVACPKCQEQVTIPPRAPQSARVRCPLCSEVYTLADALATLPPMLELLDKEPADDAFEHEPVRANRQQRSMAYAHAGAATEELTELDDNTELSVSEADSAFGAGLPHHAESITDAHGPSVKREHLHKPGQRKRKKAPNPILTMGAVMLGGVLAIPTALLILLWLPGDLRKDPLEIADLVYQYAPYLLPKAVQEECAAKLKTKDKKSEPKPDSKTVANNNSKTTTPMEDTSGPNLTKQPENNTPPDNAVATTEPAEIKPELTIEPLPETLPGTTPVPEIPLDPEMKKTEPKETPATEPTEPAKSNSFNVEEATAAYAKVAETFKTYEGSDRAAKVAAAEEVFAVASEIANTIPAKDPAAPMLFSDILQDDRKAKVMGIFAEKKLNAPEQNHAGIVVTGNVKTCRQSLDMCEMEIEVLISGKENKTYVILGPQMPEGTRVFVAGTITNEPGKVLEDYSNAAKQAIVAKYISEIKTADK